MKGASHRKVTDKAFRWSSASVKVHREIVVDEAAEVDSYRDLELVDVESALGWITGNHGRDNPHESSAGDDDDQARYERTIVDRHLNHTALNHFIDIKKGPGSFDDYDGYAYEKGSARRDGHEIYVNNPLDMLMHWYLNDEYVHAPSHQWYRGCSPSVERYSFPRDQGPYDSRRSELKARFPLAVYEGRKDHGVPWSVFMAVDNLARYWYDVHLFGNFPLALGPVMHAIQDASIPHHAAGYNGNWHVSYEADLQAELDGWLENASFQREVKALHDRWKESGTSQPDRLNPGDWRLVPSVGWRMDFLVTWVALNAYREYSQTYRNFRHGYSFDPGSARELAKIALAMSMLTLTKVVHDRAGLLMLSLAKPEEFRKVYGLRSSLRSINHPLRFVRYRNSYGEIAELGTAQQSQTGSFKIVWGLADVNEGISLEAVHKPGYYLRHQDSRIRLHKNNSSQLFKEDATFFLRPGLSNKLGSSFESFNLRGHYIRHREFQLCLEGFPSTAVGSSLWQFFVDATFLVAHPQDGFSQRGSERERIIDNIDDEINDGRDGRHTP